MPENSTPAEAFGVYTSISGLSAVMTLTGLTWSESVEIAESRKEDGKVAKRKAYSKTTTVKGDGTVNTEDMPPDAITAGGKITIDGKDYLIESCDVTQSNTDFAKASFTATRKDNETIEEYDTEASTSGAASGSGD